jgi:hypothetical protein
MESAAIHHNFVALLDQYSQHREYIRRARSQAARFSSAVVEKVIFDHEVKASGVAERILPLVPALQSRVDDIDAEKASIHREKASSDEEMQELELRLAIGETDEDGFNDASSALRDTLAQAESRLAGLDDERGGLSATLARWVELAEEAGQDTGLAPAAPPAPAPVPAPPAPVASVPDVPALPQEPVVAEEEGTHSQSAPIVEDVSAVFEEAAAEATPVEDEVAIEAGDAEQEVDFGFEEDGEADGEGDVQLDLAGVGASAPVESAGDEIGIDLDSAIGKGGEEAEAGEGRRAMLLQLEGQADEQIYPFTSDALTIGRGRDNDIQIKNDSKVSRFHCKFFKRGGHFYVEDNKSSNGTLVNGELITERRLFGGEEVIIGETFFRFRIL